jgi:hypothetical protein
VFPPPPICGGMPPADRSNGAQTGDFSNGTSGEITLGTHRVELGQSKPGVGYICVVPLDRYRPKALREVRAPVEAHAERIHSLCDVGNDEALAELKAILTGETVPQAGEVSA